MQLSAWQPFFSTLAAVVATLAGLLFVALSLNLQRLSQPAFRLCHRLAILSFSSYLYVIAIALVFLVPGAQPYTLAVLLALVGLVGLADTLRFSRQTRRAAPEGALGRYFWGRALWLLVENLGFLAVALAVLVGRPAAALHWLAAVLVVMTIGVTRRAWDLLVRLEELALPPEGGEGGTGVRGVQQSAGRPRE